MEYDFFSVLCIGINLMIIIIYKSTYHKAAQDQALIMESLLVVITADVPSKILVLHKQ